MTGNHEGGGRWCKKKEGLIQKKFGKDGRELAAEKMV